MIKAVVFDLGGVILESPFAVLGEIEGGAGASPGTISRIVGRSGHQGAWERHERGEIGRGEFITAFEAECRNGGLTIDAGAMLTAIERAVVPRPAMLDAVARIRHSGLLVAALTNNWHSELARWEAAAFREGFDVFVESAVEGVRKPDPKIYEIVCDRLGVTPNECVFLDDIGQNLKPARRLGMVTIKVGDPAEALAELFDILGPRLAGSG